MSDSTALVPFDDAYSALTNPEETQMMLDALGGETLTMGDLDVVKAPSGGGLFFDVDGEPVKEITGVILATRVTRAFWDSDDDPDGSQPDCSSRDGRQGFGNPGGACNTCELAKFSKDNEKPRCKQNREFFVMRPGHALPTIVRVPPSSLKAAWKFIVAVVVKRKTPLTDFVFSVSLEKAKNAGGIEYAKMKFDALEKLEPEQAAQVREAAKFWAPMLLDRPIVDTEAA